MNSDDYKKLALKWAPIHYQYIKLDKNDDYKAKIDLIMPVNLDCYTTFKLHKKEGKQFENDDDCWNTRNIRKRLRDVNIENLTPTAYYSIATTKNHFYIMYSFYHADDKKHPNDMEGCIVILERQENNEKLLGMITVAHTEYPKYTFRKRLLFNQGLELEPDMMEADDEKESTRPLTQQETGGHGLYALGKNVILYAKIKRWLMALIGKSPDFIVFYPTEDAPPYVTSDLYRYDGMPHTKSIYYELIDILDNDNGLWERRVEKGDQENSTFEEGGKFHGGKANPPWKWVEGLIDSLNLWENPAEITKKWFKPKSSDSKEFDLDYQKHMWEKEDH